MDYLDIEKIILEDDQRGMTSIYEKVNKGYLERSVDLILENKGLVFISTGFYIFSAQSAETDGPPGAIALGETLEKLGFEVMYVTDKFSKNIISGMSSEEKVIDFPITSHTESSKVANDLIKDYDPKSIIAIERAGLSSDGKYKNFKGIDFSKYNAKVDYLFEQHPSTVGIGDGGNEIGMGNYKDIILQLDNISISPSIITTTQNIIASTSNWGAYGLIAGISKKTKMNLIPSVQKGKNLIDLAYKLGAVEGMSGESKPWVDGRSLEKDKICLEKLNSLF